MRIDIKISAKSQKTFEWLNATDARIRNSVNKQFNIIGGTLVREARFSMESSPRTGRAYIINGRIHIASSPYNAPRNITYTLSKGISSDNDYRTLRFGHTQDYGLFLEMGTIKMKARPVLRNTLQKNINDIGERLGADIYLNIK